MTNSPYTPPIYGPAQPQVYIPQQGYPYSPEIPPNQPPANIPPGQPFPQQPGMGQQPPMEYHEPYGGQPQQQQIIPPAQYMQNMPGNQFSSENVVPNDVYVVHAANPYPKADTAADLPHKKGKKDKIKKKETVLCCCCICLVDPSFNKDKHMKPVVGECHRSCGGRYMRCEGCMISRNFLGQEYITCNSCNDCGVSCCGCTSSRVDKE
ncbi:hypothetical protein TRFO_16306 [Tritrichomonas foetus]|uniref:Uncharacterized protein n=1 Tax=Tritrichomonas foetus TaxID=1144522 RepID=A0A1J4KUL2_9EUKA|nr:hypothetical protein TRFO_16306 [Tritrichomonas foetus]|eukprot:OHT13452.1 hypothetical protein TRFO_16306 [Tritrichomonas foetus]